MTLHESMKTESNITTDEGMYVTKREIVVRMTRILSSVHLGSNILLPIDEISMTEMHTTPKLGGGL